MTIMVAEAGFEPTTSRLWASRAARLLFSAVCPFRGIPSMQYARLKAYPSLRTVVEEAGFAPARRPVSAPGTAGHTMQPASAFAILPYFPPHCCRTGKKEGM